MRRALLCHRAAVALLLLFTTMCMVIATGYPPGHSLHVGTAQGGITATYQTQSAAQPAQFLSESTAARSSSAQGTAKNTSGQTPPVLPPAMAVKPQSKKKPPSPSSSSSSSASSSAASQASAQPSSSAAVPSAAPASSSAPAASLPAPLFTPGARILTGYYGGWAAYGGYTPDKINATGIDVIDYAFASVGSDLRITASDSAIDYTNFGKLLTLKSRYPRLKTVISVGGWEDSGRFSDAALTQASRDAFSDSVVAFVRRYGFDGVDIDWEYPTGGGMAGNLTRSSDPANFVLLMQTLRAKLDARGALDGRRYILSFAGAASRSYASAVSLRSLAGSVDYAFLMAYDMHGGWDHYTDYNAPLYTPSGTSPQYKASVDGAVQAWLSNGFPAGKMVLGVPFYGNAYSGVPNVNGGLWQTFTSCKSVGFDTIRSQYLFSPAYRLTRSASALVPSLFGGSVFISYDDETSIRSKAQYAAGYGMMGVGAWDISYDRSNILVNIIRGVLD